MPKKKPWEMSEAEEAKLLEELKRLMREGRRALWKKDKEKAKKLFSKGQELAQEKGWKRDADAFKASILIDEKKFEEAISLLVPIVEMPDLHLRGHTYHRLGFAQSTSEFYDRAIASYRKALEDPGYDTPGDAWNNMGVAYYNKGNYDKALEYYRKALDTPNYDTPGYSWFNMGLTYRDKGEFDEALEWLKKARDWYKENELEEVGRVDSIIRSIKREMKLRKRGLVEAAEELSEISKLSPKEPQDPIGRIKVILEENRNKIEEYAKKEGTTYTDILAILKGWSSSVPIVSAVERERFSGQLCYGGGYFIKAGTQGIVIDPGLDFVTNLGRTGEIRGNGRNKGDETQREEHRKFHVKEITQVIVSHHHLDHYADISRINDLEHHWRIYDAGAKKRDPIHYYFDLVTNINHSLHEVSPDCIHPIDPHEPEYHLQGGVRIYTFPTKHACQSSFGCVVEVKLVKGGKRRIGYTSDTAFSDELPGKLKGCYVIIAHFSSANPEDFEGKQAHDNHLGYTGLRRLISETDAKLYVISEFWGGKGDYRIELVQKLLYDLKKEGREANIIPGDVGCLIDLHGLNIRCSRCGMWVPYEEIFVTAPEVPFGKLRYLCKNCLLG